MNEIAVLFDYDGTIADTVQEVYLGTMNVLEQSGVPRLTFENFCEQYEAPYTVFYKKLGITASNDDILKWYFAVARSDEQPFFEDVYGVLKHLEVKRVRLGIISAHYEDRIRARLYDYELAQLMHKVVGRAHVKVQAIQDFCNEYSVSPHATYYVGDFASDMRDAKNAGVIPVGITRGNTTADMLFRNGAAHCIENLNELLDIVFGGCHE